MAGSSIGKEDESKGEKRTDSVELFAVELGCTGAVELRTIAVERLEREGVLHHRREGQSRVPNGSRT